MLARIAAQLADAVLVDMWKAHLTNITPMLGRADYGCLRVGILLDVFAAVLTLRERCAGYAD